MRKNDSGPEAPRLEEPAHSPVSGHAG
jgi:hypothetical protein